MDYLQRIIGEIEVHSADGIKECFENGVSPNDYFKDKPLIYELITAHPLTNTGKYPIVVWLLQ